MPFLSLPAIWLIVFLLCTNGIAGIMWFVKATEATAYKERAAACQAKHDVFIEQTRAAGKLAAEKAKAKETENRRIHDETAKGWASALDVVRRDADKRMRQYANASARVSPVPGAAVDTVRIAETPAEPLPPVARVVTDCAETTLMLVWLQHHVKQVLHE
jgi:hypothetical protein